MQLSTLYIVIATLLISQLSMRKIKALQKMKLLHLLLINITLLLGTIAVCAWIGPQTYIVIVVMTIITSTSMLINYKYRIAQYEAENIL